MAEILHSNNALAFLLNPVGVGDTTIVLQSGQGVRFPAIGVNQAFFVTVEDRALGLREIMLCTARATDSLTVTRAQQGTPATAFSAGTSVSNRITAGFLNSFAGDIATAISTSEAAAVAAASSLAVANQAQATADQALSLAGSVSGTADQAMAMATEAKGLAQTAQAAAEGAQTSADQAALDAGAAQTSANQALATATTAAQDASEALSTANAVQADLSNYAPLASPALTGVPTVPTAPPGTNTTQAASTAFVIAAVAAGAAGAGFAPINSPAFTGTPTTPAPATDANNQQIPNTAWVQAAILLGLGAYAPITSPDFQGIPKVPTADPGTSTTQAASTAFVTEALADVIAGTGFLPITGGELAGPGNLKVGGTLEVTSYATFMNGIASPEPTANNYMAGALTVAGDATFNGSAQLNGALTATGGANLTGGVDVSGSLSVSNDAAVGTLIVTSGGINSYGDVLIDGGGLKFIGGPQTISFLKSGADTVTVRVVGDAIQLGNAAWSTHSMLGKWEAAADPTTALGVATKQYVDAQSSPTLTEVQVTGTGVKAFTVSKNTRNVYITPTGGNIQIGVISGLVVGQSIMVFMKQDSTDRTVTLDGSSNAVLATADALNMVSGANKRAYAVLTGGRKTDGSVEPTFFKMTGPA